MPFLEGIGRQPSGKLEENGEEQAGAKSPDETPQPEELTKNLFKLPENVGSNYFYDADEGNIKFLGQDEVNLDPNDKAGLHLLRILRGQPVYMFKILQEWRVACQTEYKCVVDKTSNAQTREATLK